MSQNPSSPPSVLIAGTGARACLFAARLSAAEIQVIMLGTWRAGIAALRSTGVTLIESDGSERSYPVRVAADPEDCQGVDLALVLVKSWQTERTARQLRAYLPPQVRVLTLQNGLGNRQMLAEILGQDRVFQGVTTSGGTLLGPGRVRSGGEGLISIETDPQLTLFAEAFQRAGFPVESTSEIESLIWGKLAVNAAINPLTTLLGVPNGVLLEQPQSRRLMALAANEVAAVASAQDIQLPYDELSAAVEDVARRTAHNHSSMLQDIQRGAPTEIEAINGAVVRAAERAGISVPVNQSLFLLVKAMAAIKHRSQNMENDDLPG
jgi:2-dehydropantoate 2-reductase